MVKEKQRNRETDTIRKVLRIEKRMIDFDITGKCISRPGLNRVMLWQLLADGLGGRTNLYFYLS